MGNRVRELREERKLTVSSFARLLGMSDHTVRQWEAGRQEPTKHSARRIARTLGIHIDQVFTAPEPTRAEVKGEKGTIAAAIVTRNDQVLLTRRRFREGELVWGFPSGAVEDGETPQQAVEREVREELGFEVRATDTIGERIHPATHRHMAYIACSAGPGEPELVDHEELAEVGWVTLERLAALIPAGIFEPVQQYLDHALVHA